MKLIFFGISIVLQLAMFSSFLHEAVYTDLGKLCRVKCSLAAVFYFIVATFLFFGLRFMPV
ncbi:hypothetical protein CWM47_01035 [Spirosoma pollinicola]|uniref:Uncharacterized protein n=1 Tax=Spirosoma pollinicola TaxID=2057025 RepID=A0A2K8YSC8_9BACT|nr:hypothetical protein CWM47_01035 [Spirosoma pollinicola]